MRQLQLEQFKSGLEYVNQAMLGNTNRAILFTTVNLSPDAPRLSKMLAYLANGVYTWEEFREQVKQQLTVRSFPEFLDKFQPCFYYRLRPPVEVEASPYGTEGSDDIGYNAEASDAESPVMEEGTIPDGETLGEEAAFTLEDLPYYEFSLEGGPPELGWKRVVIDLNHPYLRSLQNLIKERALARKTTFQVNIDAALFGFKPRAQHMLVRKTAQDLQAATEKLMLEMRRNPDSPDTRRALEAYDRKLRELENALGDEMRQLPIITYGLGESYKALGGRSAPGAGLTPGDYVLALGERARVVAKPRELPSAQERLAALEPGRPQGERVGGEIVLLSQALESRPLAKRELRQIAQLPQQEQYPALIGSFMSEMVRLNRVDPLIGNMLAVVLQNPQQLATWSVNPQEVAVYHDTFLGIYSAAVENFLRTVTPLFETLMGVYLLFNEFPPEVRRGQPELIVTNDELTDLWQIYPEELAYFLRSACHQATNQYRHAIGFAIVPSVLPFAHETPKSPLTAGYISAGNFVSEYHAKQQVQTEEDRIKLDESIEELRQRKIKEAGGFGRVTGAGELMGLLQLAYDCGFVVFFSPEERVISGRTRAETVTALQEMYCPAGVVEQDWAAAGILCLPDFVVLPRDGVLITGKVIDGREVGVDVPELVVRSCYVAAGRFMANDNPEVLRAIVNKLPAPQPKVRPQLPGIAVDLSRYPTLGHTRLAADHFLEDAVLRQLIGRDKPFLVFSQVSGIPPYIIQAHTLRRFIDNGERYMPVHHYRQQVYLRRLFLAARHYVGILPEPQLMNDIIDRMLKFFQWYDINHEGYVNAFPSELEGDKITVQPIEEGGELRGYTFTLPFKAAVTGEMLITFA
ncbi:hypothetical protein HRbin15_02381 [bacterium HR15]|nr:hypothetical protein HRbin15_02381 [bacterium HR15]